MEDFDFPGLQGLESLQNIPSENQTESSSFNLTTFDLNISIPFNMIIPENNSPDRPKMNLKPFLKDLKVHISGEADISGWCFWMMIFIYLIVVSIGVIGNGMGK